MITDLNRPISLFWYVEYSRKPYTHLRVFQLDGLNNPDDLTLSCRLATLETHVRIALFGLYYHTLTRGPVDNTDLSESQTASSTPPPSPEDSQWLQEAIHSSYLSHKANLQFIPVANDSALPQADDVAELETEEAEDSLVGSVVDLSDSLLEDASTLPRDSRRIFVQWNSVLADTVLNEVS